MAEPIEIATLCADARAFLSELALNNDRDWFSAQKARYDSRLKRPAERLLALVAPQLAQGGILPRAKLFRPHRDVRFSEDKTPYHTHLHMMWSLPDGRAWMLGIAPDYVTAGVGVMAFTPDQLDRYRDAVDRDGTTLAALLEGWRVDEPALKRVPAPFRPDHAQGALLRQKGLVIWADGLSEALARDPVAAVTQVFTRADPLVRWLARVA